jgi:hypothetical protein
MPIDASISRIALTHSPLVGIGIRTCLAEFARIAGATSIGFLPMGFIGFFVKLIHIPINNIIVGG